MTPLPAPHALLTADQERALAATIRAGRRAHLLAQRHLAARLRRELPPAVSARAAAATVLAALIPLLPLDPHTLVAAVSPLLPPALAPDARQRVLAALAAWPLDQHALTAGAAARATFAAANHRLVVAFARRYDHRGLPFDDLVQEASLGLLRAIDLFDPARGTRFSTYAAWWIAQALRRALATQVPLAHVPLNVQDDRARLARQAHALHALHTALGHPPSPAELAAAAGLPRARVDALTAPLAHAVPLDLTVGDAETMTMSDLLPDPTAPRPDDEAEAQEVAAAVRAALANLAPRERAILAARHGLDGQPPRTLQARMTPRSRGWGGHGRRARPATRPCVTGLGKVYARATSRPGCLRETTMQASAPSRRAGPITVAKVDEAAQNVSRGTKKRAASAGVTRNT